MLKLHNYTAFAIFMAFAGAANAQDRAETTKQGAAAYRICAACHSLRPGLHLSGPSLAGLWAGQWLRGRFDQQTFRKVLLVVFFFIGLNLIRRALW